RRGLLDLGGLGRLLLPSEHPCRLMEPGSLLRPGSPRAQSASTTASLTGARPAHLPQRCAGALRCAGRRHTHQCVGGSAVGSKCRRRRTWTHAATESNRSTRCSARSTACPPAAQVSRSPSSTWLAAVST